MNHKKMNNLLWKSVIFILVLLIAIFSIRIFYEEPQSPSYEVTVVLHDSNNNMWNNLKVGMRAKAKESNLSLNIVKTSSDQTYDDLFEKLKEEVNYATNAIITDIPYVLYEDEFNTIANSVPIVFIRQNITSDHKNIGSIASDNQSTITTIHNQIKRNTNIQKVAIYAGNQENPYMQERVNLLEEKLDEDGIKINWIVYENDTSSEQNEETSADTMVDCIIGLDDANLVLASKYAKRYSQFPIMVIGYGVSNQSIYDTDLKTIESMIVENDYLIGYHAMTQILSHFKDKTALSHETISYTLISQSNIFTETNQSLLFPKN